MECSRFQLSLKFPDLCFIYTLSIVLFFVCITTVLTARSDPRKNCTLLCVHIIMTEARKPLTDDIRDFPLSNIHKRLSRNYFICHEGNQYHQKPILLYIKGIVYRKISVIKHASILANLLHFRYIRRGHIAFSLIIEFLDV